MKHGLFAHAVEEIGAKRKRLWPFLAIAALAVGGSTSYASAKQHSMSPKSTTAQNKTVERADGMGFLQRYLGEYSPPGGAVGGGPPAPARIDPQIRFDTAKSVANEESNKELDKLADTLKGHKGLSIVVQGFTDSQGTANMNQELSERRAENVKSELVSRGIDAGSIETVGFGEGKPIESNATAKGRSENRRVEVVVTGR